jgi:membrane protein
VADFATRFLEDPLRARVAGVLDSGALRNLTGLGMTTLCFAFLIMFMPNTKVRARAGLAGGLVAALLFVGWLLACAALQVGAAKTGKIYGSFAIVPILLAWLYVSWQIVLFGAEVAFAVQNCGTYRMESGARSASAQSRILLALSILKEAAQAMAARERGVQAAAYAAARRVPVRFLNGVIEELIEAGLLGELADAKGRFVLLRAPGELRVREVIDAVMASGADPADLGMEPADPSIAAALRSAGSGMDASLKTTTLQNLLG